MENIPSLLKGIAARGEAVLVVGLGVSGVATAKFLSDLAIKPICIERASESDFLKKSKLNDQISALKSAGVAVHFGVDGEAVANFFKGVTLAVLSPGVALESAIAGAIKRQGVRIIGELELGVESINAPAAVVTGSNGKSTTVTLIASLLNESGFSSLLCGNVGTPVVSYVGQELKPETRLVVEASSYQLESCSLIKPKVAVLLNLTDNHLERHGTLERYLEAKCNVFARQESTDFAILNFDDPKVKSVSAKVKASVLGVTKDSSLAKNPGAIIFYEPQKEQDFIRLNISGSEEDYDLRGAKLVGLHNRYDIAVSLLAARALGARSDQLAQAAKNFTPLEHRLEPAGVVEGISFINDSKSTTVAASLAAAKAIREAYPAKKLTLMLGGLAKAGSWEPLMTFLSREKKALNPIVCFGKDGRILASHCKASGLGHEISPTMADGLSLAREISKEGEIVLLSPGCASFDEFSDFEDRGNVFKSLVSRLS